MGERVRMREISTSSRPFARAQASADAPCAAAHSTLREVGATLRAAAGRNIPIPGADHRDLDRSHRITAATSVVVVCAGARGTCAAPGSTRGTPAPSALCTRALLLLPPLLLLLSPLPPRRRRRVRMDGWMDAPLTDGCIPLDDVAFQVCIRIFIRDSFVVSAGGARSAHRRRMAATAASAATYVQERA